jgi:hypothetical protein
MSRSDAGYLARHLCGRTRNLTDEQRKKQSDLARAIIKREEPWYRGRIGHLEDKIQSALWAANGEPVTTADLVRWCYYGCRWDMHERRAKEPFPDERYSLPTYPQLMAYPLGAHGFQDKSQPPFKPVIHRWMLGNIRHSARTFGKIVPGRKRSVTYWVLNPEIQFYSEAREIKTKKIAARRAIKAKAEKRKTRRYGKA